MDDLEQALVRAHEDYQPWTREKIQQVLKCITNRVPGAQYDWDAANESWGVVSRLGQGIAYLCAKVPVVVVVDPFRKEVQECVKADEAVIFEVGSFDDHRHRVTKVVLENIFGKVLTSVVSYDALSIQDLWYATVS